MTFKELGLNDRLLEGLDAMGFQKPTPIQEQAIPIVLEGSDLIGVAQTGTGKTGAFLIPVMDLIAQNRVDGVNCLIIAPTRELAKQIDNQIVGLGYFTEINSIPIYGGGDGMDFGQQKRALKGGVDFVVATPGKLLSHLNLGYVQIDKLKCLILDEADRMLDMGFSDDINRIISYLPKERQTLLFSATMPDKIRTLSKAILNEPKSVNIAISKPAEGVLQAAYNVYDSQKIALTDKLLRDKESLKSVIIFASTKSKVKDLTRQLKKSGISVAEIHSDLNQDEREKTLREFSSRQIKVLVATDIVSRGIDINNIQLVMNYDIPKSAEDYVHRIGRTARAESTGVAISLINEEDQYNFSGIEKLIEKEIPKLPLPEGFESGPAYEPNKKRSFGKYKGGGGRSGGYKGKGGKGGGYKGKSGGGYKGKSGGAYKGKKNYGSKK